jgi:hypothetical protein
LEVAALRECSLEPIASGAEDGLHDQGPVAAKVERFPMLVLGTAAIRCQHDLDHDHRYSVSKVWKW